MFMGLSCLISPSTEVYKSVSKLLDDWFYSAYSLNVLVM